MHLTGTPRTRATARVLRRAMTPPEVALWLALRGHARLRFRRQHPAGRYILDFYCAPAKLAIEVDGEAHDRGDRPRQDRERDAWLKSQGIRVVRYAARDIRDELDAVVRQILTIATERSPLRPATPATSP